MNMKLILLFSLFYFMQATAHVLFKYGSTSNSRWIPCFIIGNIVGMSCVWLLMKLYATMNANVAMGLAIGGGFLFAQIAIAVAFRTSLTAIQYIAIFVIVSGLFMLAKG